METSAASRVSVATHCKKPLRSVHLNSAPFVRQCAVAGEGFVRPSGSVQMTDIVPPCGARKTVRAYAFPPVFRPLRIRRLPCIRPRRRADVLSQRAALAGLITRRTPSSDLSHKHEKECPPDGWTLFFVARVSKKDTSFFCIFSLAFLIKRRRFFVILIYF